MPKYLRYADIQQITRDRAELEVNMCKDLLGVYNSEEVLDPIRHVVGTAFENVRFLVIGAPTSTKKLPDKVWTEAKKEAGVLQVFVRHGGGRGAPTTVAALRQSCESIGHNWRGWNAADCSDLSRFLGSVLEQVTTVEAPDFQPLHAQYKPEEYYKNYDPYKKGPQGQALPKPDKVSRSRTGDASYAPSATHTIAGRTAGLAQRVKVYDEKYQELKSGIDPFKLMEASTVRKIDLAYGLPEGADISGTTSDAIIVNQLIARFNASVPTELKTPSTTKLLQLLPLVTMISYGHHTLVESALTLTLFGFAHYRIGFYTSLLTKGAMTRTEQKSEVGGSILNTLDRYEHDRRNRHILCWWDASAGKYVGEEYCTPDEIESFRSIGSTSEKFLRYFRDRVHTQVYYGDLQPLKQGVHLA